MNEKKEADNKSMSELEKQNVQLNVLRKKHLRLSRELKIAALIFTGLFITTAIWPLFYAFGLLSEGVYTALMVGGGSFIFPAELLGLALGTGIAALVQAFSKKTDNTGTVADDKNSSSNLLTRNMGWASLIFSGFFVLTALPLPLLASGAITAMAFANLFFYFPIIAAVVLLAVTIGCGVAAALYKQQADTVEALIQANQRIIDNNCNEPQPELGNDPEVNPEPTSEYQLELEAVDKTHSKPVPINGVPNVSKSSIFPIYEELTDNQKEEVDRRYLCPYN